MALRTYKIAALVLATALLALGCNTARVARTAHGGAPGLSGDGSVSSRGGSNPNGPYMVVDHTAHLVKRPTLLDVNAAQPCQAANLSLFESGARVDGDRRSVRLNLVNHALEACRLGGYPAISLLRPDGTVLGSVQIEKITTATLEASLHPAAASAAVPAKSEFIEPSPMILIAPAGEAAFEVGWTSGDGGGACEQVGSIVIAAPGTRQSFTVHHELRVCEGRIRVTALSDGSQL